MSQLRDGPPKKTTGTTPTVSDSPHEDEEKAAKLKEQMIKDLVETRDRQPQLQKQSGKTQRSFEDPTCLKVKSGQATPPPLVPIIKQAREFEESSGETIKELGSQSTLVRQTSIQSEPALDEMIEFMQRLHPKDLDLRRWNKFSVVASDLNMTSSTALELLTTINNVFNVIGSGPIFDRYIKGSVHMGTGFLAVVVNAIRAVMSARQCCSLGKEKQSLLLSGPGIERLEVNILDRINYSLGIIRPLLTATTGLCTLVSAPAVAVRGIATAGCVVGAVNGAVSVFNNTCVRCCTSSGKWSWRKEGLAISRGFIQMLQQAGMAYVLNMPSCLMSTPPTSNTTFAPITTNSTGIPCSSPNEGPFVGSIILMFLVLLELLTWIGVFCFPDRSHARNLAV